MRVVLLTNGTIEGKVFIQEIEKIIHLEAVIIELKTKNMWKKCFQRFFGTSKYYELKAFYNSRKTRIKKYIYNIEKPFRIKVRQMLKAKLNNKPKIKKHFVSFINDYKTKKILEKVDPEWVIVFGTSIINKDLLKYRGRNFLNIHFSMLPNYRGAMSEFWQSYEENYESVGVTLHKINSKIDAGDIYVQYHTKCSNQDHYILMRYHNILTAINLLRNELIGILNNQVLPKQQNIKIKTVYKSNMLTDEIKLNYYERKKAFGFQKN